jgi:hypothetical protein
VKFGLKKEEANENLFQNVQSNHAGTNLEQSVFTPKGNAVRDFREGEAPAFEVALFPWVTRERTANSSILRPKGSRFDSPGQRPGTSPITTSSPKGAQP